MAYTRENYLNRVILVQQIYQENCKFGKGFSNVWIYENLIKPNFHISISTMYSYLTIPAAKQLKELKLKKQAANEQKKLFE